MGQRQREQSYTMPQASLRPFDRLQLVQQIEFCHRGVGVTADFTQRTQLHVVSAGGWERHLYRRDDRGSGTSHRGRSVIKRPTRNRCPPIHAIRADVKLVLRNPAVGAAVLPG